MASLYAGPYVGTAVFLRRPHDHRFLLGHRNGPKAPGRGTWGLVGGHLELGETWEHCVHREALEEVGINLLPNAPTHPDAIQEHARKHIRFLTATNDLFPDGKHYITLFFIADVPHNTEPVNLEPDKCAEWRWVNVPEMIALPIMTGIRELLHRHPEVIKSALEKHHP